MQSQARHKIIIVYLRFDFRFIFFFFFSIIALMISRQRRANIKRPWPNFYFREAVKTLAKATEWSTNKRSVKWSKAIKLAAILHPRFETHKTGVKSLLWHKRNCITNKICGSLKLRNRFFWDLSCSCMCLMAFSIVRSSTKTCWMTSCSDRFMSCLLTHVPTSLKQALGHNGN